MAIINIQKIQAQNMTDQNPQLEQIRQSFWKLLPKDQSTLEHIYTQLKQYTFIDQNTQYHNKNSQKFDNFSKSQPKHRRTYSEDKFDKNNRIRINEKRIDNAAMKKLKQNLKQKGLKYTDQHIDPSNQVLQRKLNQILKPLQIHPSKDFLKSTEVDHLLFKYRINKKYYDHKLFDGPIKYFDHKMVKFIDRKDHLYQDIIDQKLNIKEQWVQNMHKKFINVESKVVPNQSKDKLITSGITAATNNKQLNNWEEPDAISWKFKCQSIQQTGKNKEKNLLKNSKSERMLPQIKKQNIQEKSLNFNQFNLFENTKQVSLQKQTDDQYYQRVNMRYIHLLKPKLKRIGFNKYGKDLRKDDKQKQKLYN